MRVYVSVGVFEPVFGEGGGAGHPLSHDPKGWTHHCLAILKGIFTPFKKILKGIL